MGILKFKLAVVVGVLLTYGVVVFGDNESTAEMVPLNIVSMPQKGDIALIVEKATQTLFLYNFNGKFNLESKMKCSTGKLTGRKNRSGDQKTPEGVYFFTGKYHEKDLSPVYGAGAFPVDYPNQIDKEAGRTGYSIWLHGTDKKLKPRDSNGCVALENYNIEKMKERISLDYTPIVFLDKIEYIDASQNTGAVEKIDVLLRQWADSLEKGTYHKYLSHYSPDYFPDISWWGRWQKIRKASDRDFSVKLQQKSIFRDGDLYVVLIEEIIGHGKETMRSGVKKLYVAKENDGYKIRGESYKIIHYAEYDKKRQVKVKSQFLATAVKLFESAEAQKIERLNSQIKILVTNWVKDWSSGAIDNYSEFYSSNFYSSEMGKTAWVDRKRYLNKMYKYIDVKISNLNIKHDKEKIVVGFQQQYKSSGYSAEGAKLLVLVNEDKRWKIIQETWKKN